MYKEIFSLVLRKYFTRHHHCAILNSGDVTVNIEEFKMCGFLFGTGTDAVLGTDQWDHCNWDSNSAQDSKEGYLLKAKSTGIIWGILITCVTAAESYLLQINNSNTLIVQNSIINDLDISTKMVNRQSRQLCTHTARKMKTWALFRWQIWIQRSEHSGVTSARIYQETPRLFLASGWLTGIQKLQHCYTAGSWSESKPFRLSWWGKCRATEPVQILDWFWNVFVSVSEIGLGYAVTFLSKHLHRPGVKDWPKKEHAWVFLLWLS